MPSTGWCQQKLPLSGLESVRVEAIEARLSPVCVKVQHEASLQHEAQHPPGPNTLQGAVPVPLQVPAGDQNRHPTPLPPARIVIWIADKSLLRFDETRREILLTLRVFRDDVVDLVGSYQFDDQVTEGGDVFARDPYILRFRCLNTGEKKVFI